jgi:hypothetical protein
MKLSTNELKQIIKEELNTLLNEQKTYDDYRDLGSTSLNTLMGMYYKPETYPIEGLEHLEEDEYPDAYLGSVLQGIQNNHNNAKMDLEDYLGDPEQVEFLKTEGFEDVLKAIKSAIEELPDDDGSEYKTIDPADNMQGMIGGDPMTGVGGQREL